MFSDPAKMKQARALMEGMLPAAQRIIDLLSAGDARREAPELHNRAEAMRDHLEVLIDAYDR